MMTKSLVRRNGGGPGEDQTGEHPCQQKRKKVRIRLEETSHHRVHSMHPEPMKAMLREAPFRTRPLVYWPVVRKLHYIIRGHQEMPPKISMYNARIITIHIIYFYFQLDAFF